MSDIVDLEKRLRQIEERNKKVEVDKAWETSITRRVVLFILTYITIALYLKFIVGINPWINAIVPSIGFLLSTLTLPFFKRIWEKYKK